MQSPPPTTEPSVPRVLAAIERNRKRLWAVCYRMTGSRAEADDLCQEAVARAIERAEQVTADDPTGWLLRTATRLCLDHLRHRKVERRLVELVDPIDVSEIHAGDPHDGDPERATILREDVRYAVVVALQHLTPRQRSAIVLRDVCDCSLEEVAATLETNALALRSRARNVHALRARVIRGVRSRRKRRCPDTADFRPPATPVSR